MYKIFPKPKLVDLSNEFLSEKNYFINISDYFKFEIESNSYIFTFLNDIFKNDKSENYSDIKTSVNIYKIDGKPESYTIKIDNSIAISVCDSAGLYYALLTIKQLLKNNSFLPKGYIFDEPSLTIRGVLLDIGRDKIPKMTTLYDIIDMLSAVKINHIQLYMEGYSYEFKKYKYLFPEEEPLTQDDFIKLSNYAHEHFIDLVPCQNILGHMEKWLDKPQLLNLAECEDGYIFEDIYWRPPMTLNPRNENAKNFATYLLSELFSVSKSDYINVNLDEPFELGIGKNKSYVKNHSKSNLYFDYVDYINNFCNNHNKKIMMWGDQIFKYENEIKSFPKNAIILDWMYEGAGDFKEHCKILKKNEISFCLCPGTSSWASFTGRYDNMIKNIKNAVECSIKYGGEGIITTDWGDLGHWQYISSSYIPFIISASFSWSGEYNEEPIIDYVENNIFNCVDSFEVIKDLSNYYKLEKAPLYSTTLSFGVMCEKYKFNNLTEFNSMIDRLLLLSENIGNIYNIPKKPKVINMNYLDLLNYLDNIQNKILKLDLNSLVKREFLNSIKFIKHGAKLYDTLNSDNVDYKIFNDLKIDLDSIIQEHYYLWCKRNKVSGFNRSTSNLYHLLKLYRDFTNIDN